MYMLYIYLREFSVTPVILVPSACWGGSDLLILAPKPRANRTNSRRTGRVPWAGMKVLVAAVPFHFGHLVAFFYTPLRNFSWL